MKKQNNNKENTRNNKKVKDIDSIYLNVTDLSSYLYCPRKLYFKKIEGLKEPININILKGTIKHNIIENYVKNEEKLFIKIKENTSLMEIQNLFFKEYKKHIINIIKKYEGKNN